MRISIFLQFRFSNAQMEQVDDLLWIGQGLFRFMYQKDAIIQQEYIK